MVIFWGMVKFIYIVRETQKGTGWYSESNKELSYVAGNVSGTRWTELNKWECNSCYIPK